MNKNKIGHQAGGAVAHINPRDYLDAYREDPTTYLLVDVRNDSPLLTDIIEGAVAMPLDTLALRLDEIDKEQKVVVYCWDMWCDMARKAAMMMAAQGFDVRELSGGISSWHALKFPTETVAC